MAEGVAVAERQVAAGVYDNPDAPPPADSQAAPYGWVWRRGASAWTAAKRRPKPGTRREAELAAQMTSPGPVRPDSGPGEAAGPARGGPPVEDPAPGWQADGQAADETAPGGDSDGSLPRPGTGKLRFDEVPQQVKDDIAGLAGLVATPILSLLQAVDPYCGTILAQNLEPVVDATLPLICRSERIVRYFQEDQADWLLWGKLAMALKPVGQAFVEHHVLGRVQVIRDPQTGAVTIERRDRGAGPGHGDHLTPQPQPAYAA